MFVVVGLIQGKVRPFSVCYKLKRSLGPQTPKSHLRTSIYYHTLSQKNVSRNLLCPPDSRQPPDG